MFLRMFCNVDQATKGGFFWVKANWGGEIKFKKASILANRSKGVNRDICFSLRPAL